MNETLPSEANIRPIWWSFTLPWPESSQTPKQMFPPAGGRNAFSNSVPSECQVLKVSTNWKELGGPGGITGTGRGPFCHRGQVPITNAETIHVFGKAT